MKLSKQNITIIGLAVGLGLFATFYGMDKLAEETQEQLAQAFQAGYERGATDFVSTLFQQTEDCNITPVHFNNFSKSVVDVSCVQRSQGQP